MGLGGVLNWGGGFASHAGGINSVCRLEYRSHITASLPTLQPQPVFLRGLSTDHLCIRSLPYFLFSFSYVLSLYYLSLALSHSLSLSLSLSSQPTPSDSVSWFFSGGRKDAAVNSFFIYICVLETDFSVPQEVCFLDFFFSWFFCGKPCGKELTHNVGLGCLWIWWTVSWTALVNSLLQRWGCIYVVYYDIKMLKSWKWGTKINLNVCCLNALQTPPKDLRWSANLIDQP